MYLFALASLGDKHDLSYKAACTCRIQNYLERFPRELLGSLTTTQNHLEEKEDWELLAGARGRSGKVLTNQVKALWEGKAKRNQETWHKQELLVQCPRVSPQTEEVGPLLLIKLEPPFPPPAS